MDRNTILVWALWHNIDPETLVAGDLMNDPDYMRVRLRDETRSLTTLSARTHRTTTTDTTSHPNSRLFPVRPAQYVKLCKVRRRQNQVRVQFTSSTLSESGNREPTDLRIRAQPSTFNEHIKEQRKKASAPVTYPTNETFLTEMPDVAQEANENHKTRHGVHKDVLSNRVCLPAFLPTVQAKATPQKKTTSERQTDAVKKYLEQNDLTQPPIQFHPCAPVTSTVDLTETPATNSLVSSAQNLSMLARPSDTKKSKQRKSKFKSRKRPKKGAKLYTSKSRQQSSHSTISEPSSTSSLPPNYVYSDLVSHFSRISMRQVQATLNSAKLALPSII